MWCLIDAIACKNISIMLHRNGIKRDQFETWDDFSLVDPVAEEAKRVFFNETALLAESGLFRPYVGGGCAHWRVDPRDRSIKLANWKDMITVEPGAWDDYLGDIRELLWPSFVIGLPKPQS
jgi:hypothetical protein